MRECSSAAAQRPRPAARAADRNGAAEAEPAADKFAEARTADPAAVAGPGADKQLVAEAVPAIPAEGQAPVVASVEEPEPEAERLPMRQAAGLMERPPPAGRGNTDIQSLMAGHLFRNSGKPS